jgi:mannose/fructose-specific phosphotransferase system component IIA
MTRAASSTKMISAIVVTHGRLADEFIATARKIFGNFSGVYALSNEDKSPQALTAELEAIIEAGGPDETFVVFVDFLFGSCGHATLAAERRYKNVRVVSGVNLPMLLAFLNKRNDVNFERLPSELASRGRDSIQSVDTDQL